MNAIVIVRRKSAVIVLDAGKVNDRIDSFEQRTPVERLGEAWISHDFDAVREGRNGRVPHRGVQRVAAIRECSDHSTAKETGCAGDQHAARFLAPRLRSRL